MVNTHLTLKKVAKKTKKQCFDCIFWVGRCLKGRKNRIAADDACEDFNGKKGAHSK
jgi:hypothetical protein